MKYQIWSELNATTWLNWAENFYFQFFQHKKRIFNPSFSQQPSRRNDQLIFILQAATCERFKRLYENIGKKIYTYVPGSPTNFCRYHNTEKEEDQNLALSNAFNPKETFLRSN